MDEARQCLAMTRQSLEAARVLRGASVLRNALAEAYFAMQQAARALVVSRGRTARMHRGVLQLLREEFGGSGGLPAASLRAVARAQDLRESSH